jgi:hypothetical protein
MDAKNPPVSADESRPLFDVLRASGATPKQATLLIEKFTEAFADRALSVIREYLKIGWNAKDLHRICHHAAVAKVDPERLAFSYQVLTNIGIEAYFARMIVTGDTIFGERSDTLLYDGVHLFLRYGFTKNDVRLIANESPQLLYEMPSVIHEWVRQLNVRRESTMSSRITALIREAKEKTRVRRSKKAKTSRVESTPSTDVVEIAIATPTPPPSLTQLIREAPVAIEPPPKAEEIVQVVTPAPTPMSTWRAQEREDKLRREEEERQRKADQRRRDQEAEEAERTRRAQLAPLQEVEAAFAFQPTLADFAKLEWEIPSGYNPTLKTSFLATVPLGLRVVPNVAALLNEIDGAFDRADNRHLLKWRLLHDAEFVSLLEQPPEVLRQRWSFVRRYLDPEFTGRPELALRHPEYLLQPWETLTLAMCNRRVNRIKSYPGVKIWLKPFYLILLAASETEFETRLAKALSRRERFI